MTYVTSLQIDYFQLMAKPRQTNNSPRGNLFATLTDKTLQSGTAPGQRLHPVLRDVTTPTYVDVRQVLTPVAQRLQRVVRDGGATI